MAVKFVRSAAAGAGTGADWANAFTTLAAALAAMAAGDTAWVADDHAETQASAMTLTSPGTIGNPCFIYCVDHTKAAPASADLRTTATVTTTLNNTMTINGSFYCYGVIFSCGSGANSPTLTVAGAVSAFQTFENCSLRVPGTSGSVILFGVGRVVTTLLNTTLSFGSVGAVIQLFGRLVWRNTASALLGSVPTTLFTTLNSGTQIICEGVDLSAAGSGKTLVGAINGSIDYFFKDCKFGASVTVAAAQPGPGGGRIFVTRSDSAAANYRAEKYDYQGTELTETSVVRTGGASDGTTPQSRKLATTANSKWVLPFEALPIVFWNDQITGNITLTLEGTINAGAVPNNDDIWIEAEYLGSALTPIGSFATSTKADNLAAGAALTASAKAWGGGGSGAGWSPFTLTKTIPAPAQKGPITVYVKAGKASTTYYVDPLITVS